MKRVRLRRSAALVLGLLLGAASLAAHAQEPAVTPDAADGSQLVTPPFWGPQGLRPARDPKEVATVIQILVLLTVLTLAPAFLVMTTCFTRIIVVLSLLRQALATQQLPPNQVLIGLALFLTFLVMGPVYHEVYTDAFAPYLRHEIELSDAYWRAVVPVRTFMISQTRTADLRLFLNLSRIDINSLADWGEVPTRVLVPAFIISELKTAFMIGFYIFLPFLIIDLVIASILISMGMLMLPPVLISLPFKLLLFVMVDGWRLLAQSLVKGYMIRG